MRFQLYTLLAATFALGALAAPAPQGVPPPPAPPAPPAAPNVALPEISPELAAALTGPWTQEIVCPQVAGQASRTICPKIPGVACDDVKAALVKQCAMCLDKIGKQASPTCLPTTPDVACTPTQAFLECFNAMRRYVLVDA